MFLDFPMKGIKELPNLFTENTHAVDVIEKEDKYVVSAELSGFKKENIKIESKDNVLFLSGKYVNESNTDSDNYIRKERSTAHFSRTIVFDEDISTTTKATFENGLLTIEIPKEHKDVPKHNIEIE